uniref:Uncharacterized protein n=1 Tax=Octactis speculum TaxID=3111310 RepID=A0A7S2AHX2_9STRA|mmetsp:Transcript_10228/g.13395  ORF Transcript_10228/g.13395 Transcript_10228/m.13395 type:complete len:433 (+) Transcript_10228:22-1320(+)
MTVFDTATIIVVVLPAVVMIIGESACGLTLSERSKAMAQNLSAGLILGALSSEINPQISSILSTQNAIRGYMNIFLGGATALVTMFLVQRIDEFECRLPWCGSDTDKTDDKTSIQMTPQTGYEKVTRAEPFIATPALLSITRDALEEAATLSYEASQGRSGFDSVVHSLSAKVHNMLRTADKAPNWTKAELNRLMVHVSELEEALKLLESCLAVKPETRSEKITTKSIMGEISKVEAALEHLHSHIERATFRRWSSVLRNHHYGGSTTASEGSDGESVITEPESNAVLVFTVCVDAAVDGVLVGLCAAVDIKTAFIMASATCLEMGFLGLAYSSSLRGPPSASKMLNLILPPVLMTATAAAGALIGDTVISSDQSLLLALLSFACVALVFLVTQELLIEAHEATSESTANNQIATCSLFFGMFLSFLLSELS